MPLPPSSYISPSWAPNQFLDKVVFCTGGAGTICSAQVRALVHLGANACIVGRNAKKTEDMARDIASAREGARVVGIGSVDVRKIESLQEAVERCVRELGGIDIAIAGAAGNFLAPLTQISPNAFKSVIDIDVLGSYNTVKAVLPHLQSSAQKNPSSSPARLIFVSATLHYAGTALQTHVTTAKAAVDALSANCAIELGPRGITSNVIAPGGIAETEGVQRLAPPEALERVARRTPMGRMGTVKDVADATVWLCSEAGHFVNGTRIVVDGGEWRTADATMGQAYPDFLLSGDAVTGVKSGRKSKL